MKEVIIKNKRTVFLAILFSLPFAVLGDEINTAISLRSAKLEGNKFDFYISFGYEKESFLIDLAYERENGGYYTSDHVWLNLNRYSKISHLSDEIRNIDIESFLLYVPFSVFNLGIDQTWRKFSDPKVLMNFGMKLKFLEINYSSNFKNREIIVSKLRFKRNISKKVNLVLTFQYRKFNSDGVWRSKLGINYVF